MAVNINISKVIIREIINHLNPGKYSIEVKQIINILLHKMKKVNFSTTTQIIKKLYFHLNKINRQYIVNLNLYFADRVCNCFDCYTIYQTMYHTVPFEYENCICCKEIFETKKMKQLKALIQLQKRQIVKLGTFLNVCRDFRHFRDNKIQFNPDIFKVNLSHPRYVFSATMRGFLEFRYPEKDIFKSDYLYQLGMVIPTNLNESSELSLSIVNGKQKNVKRYSMKAILFIEYLIKILYSLPIDMHYMIFNYLKPDKRKYLHF